MYSCTSMLGLWYLAKVSGLFLTPITSKQFTAGGFLLGSCPVLQKFSREYTIECCFVVLGLSAGILCGSASISSQRCPQKCEQHDSLIVENINKFIGQDYLLMLFHHIFTVLLLGMAFVVNGVQIGTLILLSHDISDVPLEVWTHTCPCHITLCLFFVIS